MPIFYQKSTPISIKKVIVQMLLLLIKSYSTEVTFSIVFQNRTGTYRPRGGLLAPPSTAKNIGFEGK